MPTWIGKSMQNRCWEFEQELPGSKLTLRSGTPQTVMREVRGTLFACNLIRLEMAENAKHGGAPLVV